MVSGAPESAAPAVAVLGLLAWFLTEVGSQAYAGRGRKEANPSSGQDRGSFFVVAGSIAVATTAIFILYNRPEAFPLPGALLYAGIVVLGVGLFVRGWALIALGEFFSVVVRTSPGQRLIRAGPYRLLRHPSYTGNILIVLGFGLILPTAVGLVIGLGAVLAGHLYRVGVEEKALQDRFPEEYPKYVAESWRLFPGIF
ncbi:MAG: isoprenylcysteine carboxylmethyltransferase family protein [Thermoplasmata archaeon]|nr:isoprenylcysteine carboxylmethyltransferase family protein [Thermoplasmata archaeon]